MQKDSSYELTNNNHKITMINYIDKTITLGYIHDIGKYIGKSHGHVMRGYNYIKDLGYDEEYANICLTHSYLNLGENLKNSLLCDNISIIKKINDTN